MEPLSADDPKMIGDFRLHARLGAGGMGQVYLGFSPAGRAVAIKVVHTQFARDQEFLQRFSREVAAAGAVSGMYTAPVVGYGLGDIPPWLATAFVPGPPLSAVVARYGPLPEPAVWRLAAGLAEALRAVHAAGLVHRDLKPANVLIADDGPHVIDFGISRAFQGTQLTSAGMVIGTPGYMSPEQAEGQVSGPAGDIFALGCVVAYAFTGSPPFGDGTAASILYRVVRTEPDLSAIPPALRQLIEACLKKNPAERPDPAQLIGMISALGPATEATLGSFWPGSVARVIAAEQASQTPAGLTPPAPVAGPGLTSGPAQPAVPGASPALSGLGAPSGSSVLGSPVPSGLGAPSGPAPAERTPTALATPGIPGPGAGATGHAPMITDGYYAAAQGRATPNPAGPGASSPPVPQPYAAQRYAGQPYAAQPYAGQPGTGTPSSWPQQQGSPGTWPMGSAPGPTGGDALAQYTRGSRSPLSAEIPPAVRNAARLMYAGFAATAVALVASLMVLGRYAKDAKNATNSGHPVVEAAANRMAGAMTVAVLADAIGLVCWVVIAMACRRGRGWTRVAGTVLLGSYTVVMLLLAFRTHNDPGARVATLLAWILGIAAATSLWTQQAREFFGHWRRR
jgi:serine/threonine kinase PknH